MYSYNCCGENNLEFKKLAALSSLLKTVAEESRLKLLCILQNQEHCVCEIMEQSDMSQSLISHHLATLKEMHLVENDKRGQRVYYNLTHLGESVMSLIAEMQLENHQYKNNQ